MLRGVNIRRGWASRTAENTDRSFKPKLFGCLQCERRLLEQAVCACGVFVPSQVQTQKRVFDRYAHLGTVARRYVLQSIEPFCCNAPLPLSLSRSVPTMQ